MARLPRVVVVDVPHHVTQRGNARQAIFNTDADRLTYLTLLTHSSGLYGLSLLGYCLMSNHVHLMVVPQNCDSLALSLKQAHGRYACFWNAGQSSSGHVWQGRFYSCALDDTHLWRALRYTELNPVRAGMVATAEQWRWSSASAHCGLPNSDATLDTHRWSQHWTSVEWRQYLGEAEASDDINALRQATHTGRPLGAAEFVESLERSLLRPLRPQKGGRPKKPVSDPRQNRLTFVA